MVFFRPGENPRKWEARPLCLPVAVVHVAIIPINQVSLWTMPGVMKQRKGRVHVPTYSRWVKNFAPYLANSSPARHGRDHTGHQYIVGRMGCGNPHGAELRGLHESGDGKGARKDGRSEIGVYVGCMLSLCTCMSIYRQHNYPLQP